jgi:CheY-like chemotaxis protein
MKSILFVDDHKPLAHLSCEILRMHGYTAEFAYSAYEALEKYQREHFDMVVTDLRMEGMDGLQLAHELRQRTPELPVVVVTGCSEATPSSEVSAWVPKQIMFPVLIETIQRLFQEVQGSGEHTAQA